jgi:hypothetical protein
MRWNIRRDSNDLNHDDDEEQKNDFSFDGLGNINGNGMDDDAAEYMGVMLEPEDDCETYQAYLESFYQVEPKGTPVSHEDFHLLEAELELLTRLGQEFGRLLREQEERKEYLAASIADFAATQPAEPSPMLCHVYMTAGPRLAVICSRRNCAT